MGITVITPSPREPLTLAEAKQHLRVDITDDDTLIWDYITTARQMVETFTHRQLLTATLRMTLDAFPPHHRGQNPLWGGEGILSARLPHHHYHHHMQIEVERPPLRSVQSVVYVSGDGSTVTLDPSAYIVDVDSTPGRISPAHGTCWPAARHQQNAVVITYTAGFDYLDPRIKIARSAMRLLIGNWYENREAVGSKLLGVEVPFAVQSLLSALAWGDYR